MRAIGTCANSVGFSEAMRPTPPLQCRGRSLPCANSVGFSEAMRLIWKATTTYNAVKCQQRWFLGSDATDCSDFRWRANLVPTALVSRKRCDRSDRPKLPREGVPTALVSRKRCDVPASHHGVRTSGVPTALVSRKRCDYAMRFSGMLYMSCQQRWFLGSDATKLLEGMAAYYSRANSVGFSEAMRQLHYSHRYDQVFCCLLRAREAYSGIYCLMCGNNGITPN